MNILFACCCFGVFLWLAAEDDDDDEYVSHPPADAWDTADAFRPGSGRFGWTVCPGVEVEED